ncbi:hypothetical protein [Cupriavidus campinensis]|uniref:hypothetical protein n=1 Tax=Cupriavidus campinensis TaxID=151783 RepID=UPI0016434DA2|nr:hypothetical protein [Cupriavidus campinensis]
MHNVRFLLSSIVLAWSVGASAQVGQPKLTVTDMQVFCQGLDPFVTLTFPVNAQDQARPGILYVGMHDPSMSQAAFLTTSSWVGYSGGLFPAYSVASAQLGRPRLTLALPQNLAGGGWKLYVGYGALSVQSESRVQQAADAIAAAKAISPKPVIGAVDPDHYRRTLVQTDMTQAGKFAYVETGVENNPFVCRPETGGGG